MKHASIRTGSDEDSVTPGIGHFEDVDSESEARALADFEAGRYHDHAIVSQWLKTWGTPGYKPFGEWLAARDG